MDESILKGPWSKVQIDKYLDSSIIPLRFAYTSIDGWPSLLSLWFIRYQEYIWCATSPNSFLVRSLRQTSECSFEVAVDKPPYRGVRGRGEAVLVPEKGEVILEGLVDRYINDRDSDFSKWLLSRKQSEMAICIKTARLTSWDFSTRMSN